MCCNAVVSATEIRFVLLQSSERDLQSLVQELQQHSQVRDSPYNRVLIVNSEENADLQSSNQELYSMNQVKSNSHSALLWQYSPIISIAVGNLFAVVDAC